MTPVLIGAIVALAAGGGALLVGSLALWLVWRVAERRLHRVAPHVRARSLAALRLSPAACSAGATALVFISFIRLEPADAREALGFVLPALAVATITVVAARALGALRSWRAAARVLREWRGTEATSRGRLPVTTVDTTFPVVAVVGVLKPRLYISRRVIAACEPPEVDAMIAHEAAHVSARDNLTRLLFLCAPMVPIGRTGSQIEDAWTRAAEEAADDRARCDRQASLALASALTKVARLAARTPSPLPAPLRHASAILSGNGIEHRVRRLLAGDAPREPLRWLLALAAAPGAIAMLALSPPARRLLYEAAEHCVRHLP